MVGEILELDQHAGKHLLGGHDQLVDQLVVGRAGDAVLAQADVERVGEQCLVVGADVDGDGQAQARVDSGAGRVERQLADRNAHALSALVAEAEDALAVGHDDDAGAARPVPEHPGDPAAIVGGNEQAARPLEDPAEALARESDGRRVDDRLYLIHVIADHAEEQRLVAVVQRVQRDILVERIGQVPQLLKHALHLLLLRVDMRRQQAAQPERVTLLLGEGRALVQQRVVQEREPAGQPRHCSPGISGHEMGPHAIGRPHRSPAAPSGAGYASTWRPL